MDEDLPLDLDFVFPEDERPPSPEPTISIYRRNEDGGVTSDRPTGGPRDVPKGSGSWNEITIKLVGSHPLWGHYLWNAARAFASYLDDHPEYYVGRDVLELGAGGGLPGIVTAKNDARKVVLTDYPDNALIQNLRDNVQANIQGDITSNISVEGYIWGQPVRPLLDLLHSSRRAVTSVAIDHEAVEPHFPGFDLVILSDLIFNHSQHGALLQTCEQTLSRVSVLDPGLSSEDSPATPGKVTLAKTDNAQGTDAKLIHSLTKGGTRTEPSVLVFYTHHRPHLAHKDMEFFDEAQRKGWRCEKILERKFPPMFPKDPGEEAVRATVHGWKLTRTT